MLYLDDILYEIEESEIWSFNYNIMEGTIYLSQNLKFIAPVKIGDTITAKVEIVELNQEKKKVGLKTTCTNQNGVLVIDGEAKVLKK